MTSLNSTPPALQGLAALKSKDFAAVPYLETSSLMLKHKGRVKFSKDKPNILVGPNGSGKSALLTALALHTFAYYTGQTSWDHHFVIPPHGLDLWKEARGWARDQVYLDGLVCEVAPGKPHRASALYFRPNLIPGAETSITTAMMTGYFDSAKAYARQVENKSSGQATRAVMEQVLDVLRGAPFPSDVPKENWSRGSKLPDRSGGYVDTYDHRAEAVRQLTVPRTDTLPLILMDEPEQSLDALAEAQLWKAIERTDCSKTQVIVASHSLYPLMHPERFNLIETETGFVRKVLKTLAMPA